MEHTTKPFRWAPHNVQLPEVNVNKPDEIRDDEPFEEYLADNSCISSSGIRHFLQSPRHFWAQISGFSDDEEDKPHLKFGRAVHMLILEPKKFYARYVVMPEFIGLTKDGRESKQSGEAKKKKEAWMADLSPFSEVITQEDMDHILNMAESLMDHPQAANLLKNGRPEVSGRWTHHKTGVRVRIRPDYVSTTDTGIYISDLKTSRDPAIDLFSKDMSRFRYHIQLAIYRDGIAQILGKQIEAVALIAMEKKPPYTVNLYWLNDEDLELGRLWYEHALVNYVKAKRLNKWPQAQVNGVMINLNSWARTEALPEYEFGEDQHAGLEGQRPDEDPHSVQFYGTGD